MEKSNIIIGLAGLTLAGITALVGGMLWLGGKIGSLETAVERNAQAITELRSDIGELRSDMKEGDAELRELILLHITGQHGVADADIGGKKQE